MKRSDAASAIEVSRLVVQYGEDRILDGVSLEVAEGEIFAILGGSGCGKSTLMRHMIGLEKPFSGNVRIRGRDIGDEAGFDETLREIGVLFQGGALIGSMTVAENVALPIRAWTALPETAVADLVRMKLCMVDLARAENLLPSQISGGMKKRAGLARALALNPGILFLDEPSAGLDPVTAVEIDELILSINRMNDTTMVIVTHELESIFKVARRVVMLDKRARGVIAEGDPRKLKEDSDNPRVRRFFNRTPDPDGFGTTGGSDAAGAAG